jgi:hypothetical protein
MHVKTDVLLHCSLFSNAFHHITSLNHITLHHHDTMLHTFKVKKAMHVKTDIHWTQCSDTIKYGHATGTIVLTQ